MRWFIKALIASPWVFQSIPAAQASPSQKCLGSETSITIDLDRSRLHLCEEGISRKQYRVALGQKGIAKRKRGDKKTPTGTYRLGTGRHSPKYHRFIPVGYPTSSQRAQGYTGSAIGIHGPKRNFRWLGPLGTMANWTLGCIAVSTDPQIEEIEAWAKEKRVRSVHLIGKHPKP